MFGLGYVGMTAAACLARNGHEVIGVDVSDEKVAIVNAGKSPITEPGLDEFVARAVRKGFLSATKDARGHLDSCAMAIVCVGTPSAPDGSHNMSFIVEVSHQIAELVSPARATMLTVVFRSTVRPGTIEELVLPIFEDALQGGMGRVELVYNPEFLRSAAAGFNAVTVFALYISSDTVRQLYRHPDALWLVCPILMYWLARAVIMANRRLMNDDPIVFALKDRNSLLAFALITVIMVGAA